jgi:hypothetical protein
VVSFFHPGRVPLFTLVVRQHFSVFAHFYRILAQCATRKKASATAHRTGEFSTVAITPHRKSSYYDSF